MKIQLCRAVLFIAFLISIPIIASAGDVTLAWDPSVTPDVAGYRLYYGTNSRSYGYSIDVRNVTTYTVSDLVPGTYFFAVTAYVPAGNESGYSDEVSASVSATEDAQPPVFVTIGTSSAGVSSSIISWTTDEASDSQVDFGPTAAYGATTTLDSRMVTAHSQTLTGLNAGTLYHYRVKSRDAAGNLAVSGDLTFATALPPDTTPPVISGVTASNVTFSTATISWTTNENSSAQLEYGTTTAYGASTRLDTAMVTSHSQSLTGLTPDTTYHYRVKSTDAAGNQVTSGDFTFATRTAIEPVAAFAFDEGTGTQSADLSGNGNTASLHSALWAKGKNGSSLSFDGTGSYASAGTTLFPGMNQPQTVSFWMYLEDRTTSLTSMLSFAGPEGGASMKFGYRGTQIGVLGAEDTWMAVASCPSLHAWHHFGYVFDGSQHLLYIDGVLAGTSTIAPVDAPVTGFEIGRRIGGSEYLKGRIDDVRVYVRALGADELNSTMNTPLGGGSAEPDMPEEPLSPEDSGFVLQPAVQMTAGPTVNIDLERSAYRPGETVSTAAFWITNPSSENRTLEVKTWIVLPGMQPLPLALTPEDTISLAPGAAENLGGIQVMQIAEHAPLGTAAINVRLTDPVTGQVLSEDLNPFTIWAKPSRWRLPVSLEDIVRENPDIALERDPDGALTYVVLNPDPEPAAVEIKVWLEAPGMSPISVISAGADSSLIVPAGAHLTLDPLASRQPPAGTYTVKVRILDAACGEILQESQSDLVIP